MTDRRRPGWYRDRTDPSRVVHWNGRGWSGAERAVPAWAVSETDVTVDRTWGSLRPDAGGPLLEGPVRPTLLPATTRATLAGQHGGPRTQRLVRASAAVGRPPRGPSVRAAASFEPQPGWRPARRPLTVFCALVGVAVMMMAATFMGVSGPRATVSPAIAGDIGFVARAASVCEAGLTVLRSRPPTTMATPGDSAASGALAQRSSAAVGAVEQQLRAVPAGNATAAATGAWLDDLHNYTVDEQQLAITLGASSHSPGTPPSPSARPVAGTRTAVSPGAHALQAETIAMRVSGDIRLADTFANANGLAACDLAPPTGPSPLLPIP